jgi:hypothetical protein
MNCSQLLKIKNFRIVIYEWQYLYNNLNTLLQSYAEPCGSGPKNIAYTYGTKEKKHATLSYNI